MSCDVEHLNKLKRDDSGPPEEKVETTIDIAGLIEQLQKNPELAATLAGLIGATNKQFANFKLAKLYHIKRVEICFENKAIKNTAKH